MSDPFHTTVKMPLPDQVIDGKYRIISRIGSGGMGLVFLAERVGVGNRVALKFLDPEPNDDDTRIARFLREAKVGLEVQHPGAAQVLDLGRDESMRLYLCFELVEGEDLREVLKREGRLRYGEARDITSQVAQVLAFAHGRNIVHRDVKPENIRVRRELAGTHVKVLDFGIARLLKDTGVRLTAEGMLAGTPRYMAPEQVRDEPLDGRTDQYALGLMFFEMLTGAVAIGGKNVTQILMHQMQTVVPPLGFVDASLANPAIDAFVARACAKEPSHRFPSMADFITALKGLMIDERAWPVPRVPSSAAHTAPTKDTKGKSQPDEVPLSDTYIRVPERTELERRLEVPTDPVREPVQRRFSSPDGATAPLPAHQPLAPVLVPLPIALSRVDPPTDPQGHQAAARPPPQPDLTVREGSGRRRGESKPNPPPVMTAPPAPALEMPTDPERPFVARQVTTVPAKGQDSKQTLMGAPLPTGMAPQHANRSRAVWWLLGALLGIGSLAAAWWWASTHGYLTR
ncbi:MAG: protein kinase [Archangium sp.]